MTADATEMISTHEGVAQFIDAVRDAKRAAFGDSNDAEIALLQSAVTIACGLLEVDESVIDAEVYP